jgi:hypothetical protein
VDVRGGDQAGQRNTAAIAQNVDLAARLAPAARVWPGQLPLFSARTLIESTTACDQSMSAASPSRVRTCWCSRSPQPSRGPFGEPAMRGGPADPEHRRGQLPPGTAGLDQIHDRGQDRRIVHPQPSTTLPTYRPDGINGSAMSHKSSGAQVRTISSITNSDHAQLRPVQMRHALILSQVGWSYWGVDTCRHLWPRTPGYEVVPGLKRRRGTS